MQSSNFENNGIQYTADRAVDGNRNIEAFEAPYISSTKGKFRNTLLSQCNKKLTEHQTVGSNITNKAD
jgi:hypothetical protein